jgi:hypothetical protein
MNDEVMMNDNFTVSRSVNVQFYRVGAQLECAQKSGNRVFRQVGMRPAVGDFEWLCWTGSQSDLVLLGSGVVAKLRAPFGGVNALNTSVPEASTC